LDKENAISDKEMTKLWLRRKWKKLKNVIQKQEKE